MSSRWPGMMRRKTAAEYVDMSEAAFEREIIAGRLPAGVIFGGREHWSREAFIEGRKRDGRRTADWLLGWDQECTSAATAERLSYTPADR